MSSAIFEAVYDSLKLIPFLLATYLLLELVERAASDTSKKMIRKAGVFGPIWGSLIGVIPQCGLSVAASNFYASRIITLGTLIAIYMSTSDEMLPILLAEQVSPLVIIKILVVKVLFGMISGFFIDLLYRWFVGQRQITKSPAPNSAAEDSSISHILSDATRKTAIVFLLILLVSIVIELAVYSIGIEQISSWFHSVPVVGELIAGLIGLVPNCAASVVITQLYLDGIIGSGTMMTGLLVSAGVGLLVLCKENHSWKKNLIIIAILYVMSVCWGILIDLTGISFI